MLTWLLAVVVFVPRPTLNSTLEINRVGLGTRTVLEWSLRIESLNTVSTEDESLARPEASLADLVTRQNSHRYIYSYE